MWRYEVPQTHTKVFDLTLLLAMFKGHISLNSGTMTKKTVSCTFTGTFHVYYFAPLVTAFMEKNGYVQGQISLQCLNQKPQILCLTHLHFM